MARKILIIIISALVIAGLLLTLIAPAVSAAPLHQGGAGTPTPPPTATPTVTPSPTWNIRTPTPTWAPTMDSLEAQIKIRKEAGNETGFLDFLAFPVTSTTGYNAFTEKAGSSTILDATYYYNEIAVVTAWEPNFSRSRETFLTFWHGIQDAISGYKITDKSITVATVIPNLKYNGSYWIFYQEGSILRCVGFNAYGYDKNNSPVYPVEKFDIQTSYPAPRIKGGVILLNGYPHSALAVYYDNKVDFYYYDTIRDEWLKKDAQINTGRVLMLDFISGFKDTYLAVQDADGVISVYSSTDLANWDFHGSVQAEAVRYSDTLPRFGMDITQSNVLGLSWPLGTKVLYTQFGDEGNPAVDKNVYLINDIQDYVSKDSYGNPAYIPQVHLTYAKSEQKVVFFWIFPRRFMKGRENINVPYTTFSVFDLKTKQKYPSDTGYNLSLYVSRDLKPTEHILLEPNRIFSGAMLYSDMAPFFQYNWFETVQIDTFITRVNPSKIAVATSSDDPDTLSSLPFQTAQWGGTSTLNEVRYR